MQSTPRAQAGLRKSADQRSPTFKRWSGGAVMHRGPAGVLSWHPLLAMLMPPPGRSHSQASAGRHWAFLPSRSRFRPRRSPSAGLTRFWSAPVARWLRRRSRYRHQLRPAPTARVAPRGLSPGITPPFQQCGNWEPSLPDHAAPLVDESRLDHIMCVRSSFPSPLRLTGTVGPSPASRQTVGRG